MTAVAAVLIAGTPALVGDVVLTDREGKQRIDHAGKVYVVAPNVALGWSRNASLAKPALARLRQELSDGRVVSTEDLKRALDNLEDLRGRQKEDLDLTGWIVTASGPKVVRWSSFHRPTMFCDEESDIGDGGGALRRMLATPEIGEGNTVGYDEAPMKVISGFLEARFEEALRGDDWPRTWGAAYDAIVYQKGFFRWLPKLTYVGWDVVLDGEDRITEVAQAPVVFTQEHVHGCTLMLGKRVGDGETDVKISYPIDRDFDLDWLDWYRRRPYSAVSHYYANYIRIFLPDNHFMTMCTAVENATSNGVMCHAGADETDPHFQVNRSVLGPQVQRILQKARTSFAERQSVD